MTVGLFVDYVSIGVVTAAVCWLFVRVRKYGWGWWINHQKVKLQETASAVLATLTTTNGGDSIVDRFNRQDKKLEVVDAKLNATIAARIELSKNAEKIAEAVASNEAIHTAFRDLTNAQLAKLDTNMSNISTVVMGMRAQVDESNVVIKTVDAKITPNVLPETGIADAVERIEVAQAGQIERETT